MIVGIVKIAAGIIPLEEFREASGTLAAVAAFCAEQAPPLDPSLYWGINTGWPDDDPRLQLSWWYDFTLAAVVRDLDEVKAQIILDLKAHREARLAGTVRAEYPAASGLWFGCSAASQDNWSKLATLDARGLASWPFSVSTWDELGSHALIDSADLTSALATISGAVLTERSLCAGYIASALASADEASAQAAAAPYLAL